MKVLAFDLVPFGDSKAIFDLRAQIVDKPFSWVIEHRPFVMPDTVDVGPLDMTDVAPVYFADWEKFGEASEDRSKMVPSNIDLTTHAEAHKTLRLFGTLAMVEHINMYDFKAGADGVAAYVQFLLRCKYVAGWADFDRDLLPAARKRLTEWTEDTIYSFVSYVLVKNKSSVSLGDIAQVIEVLTGKHIDTEAKKFNLKQCLAEFPIDVAAEKRPDEFFTASLMTEVMEANILRSLLLNTQDGMYFGKDLDFAESWVLDGPEGVKWQLKVNRGYGSGASISFSPTRGTLYDRAVGSKRKMLPKIQDADVPFTLPISDCGSAVDSGAFSLLPGSIRTGIRYMAQDCSMPLYCTGAPVTDYGTLEREMRSVGIKVVPDPTPAELIDSLGIYYTSIEKDISKAFGDRHFMVFMDGLGSLINPMDTTGSSSDAIEALKEKMTSLDSHVLPGVPQTLRATMVYAWVLKHLETDTLCHVAAANDDYTIRAAIESTLVHGMERKNPATIYLICCSYSQPFQGRKVRTNEFLDVGSAPDFSLE